MLNFKMPSEKRLSCLKLSHISASLYLRHATSALTCTTCAMNALGLYIMLGLCGNRLGASMDPVCKTMIACDIKCMRTDLHYVPVLGLGILLALCADRLRMRVHKRRCVSKTNKTITASFERNIIGQRLV